MLHMLVYLTGGPQVPMGFNSKMVIHDFDDFGIPLPDSGNLHMNSTYFNTYIPNLGQVV